MFLEIIIFFFSFLFLAVSNYYLVTSLSTISQFLKIKKFVIGFIVMGLAVSLPNLFIAIYSAGLEIPELSLGEIFGGTMFLLTFVLGIVTLMSKNGINLRYKLVRRTSFLIFAISIVLLFLSFDNYLSRIDGIVLISIFFFYFYYLFSKKKRFRAIYDEKIKTDEFIKSLILFFASLLILLISTFLIVDSALFFVEKTSLSLWFLGLFVVGIFAALPEVTFSFYSVKNKEDELIIGNLVGSIIASLTLVLGTLILFHPKEIVFLQLLSVLIPVIFSSFLFFFFCKTRHKISKKEAYFLLATYFLFILLQLFIFFI